MNSGGAVVKIGELAGRTGVNPSAIRFYESLGLLREPHRMGGQRRYADDAVYRVMLIRFAGEMGFALPEVAIFLNGLRDDVPVGARWHKLARRKLAEVERGIERSLKLKSLLEHLLRCRCGNLQECVERLDLSPRRKAISAGAKAKGARRAKAAGRENGDGALDRRRLD
jgi:MerR family transcriptional regulator, redox-sensitive transcriptional activator SoxR